jgi:rod shape-determining protein MreC
MEPANPQRIQRRRTGAVLALLVFVSFLLLVISTKSLAGVPERVGFTVFSFFQRVFTGTGNFISETINSVNELRQLRANYDEAIGKLEQYQNLERGYSELKSENLRLKEQLGFARESEFRALSAEIIARDPENLSSTMVVDKGSADGVRKNLPVIAYQGGIRGVVGKIVDVGLSSSIILPVYDPNCYVAARLAKSRYEGLIHGQGSSDNPLILRYVKKRAKDEIQYGDLVITTGYESLYPKDLTIGRISRLLYREYETSVDFEVEPVIDFSRIEYVSILFPDPAKEGKND